MGRYAQAEVCSVPSSDGRMFQFTQRNAPSSGYSAHQDLHYRSCLYFDDNSNEQNPAVVDVAGNMFVGAKGGTGMQTLRVGTPVSSLKGFLQSNFGIRVRATELTFGVTDLASLRPDVPAVAGDVKVVSTNVLNYFLTLPSESSLARGADSAEEFVRQAAKISLALGMMDADVFGLVEVENSVTAAADLAAKVNAKNLERSSVAVGANEASISGDAIRCDYIYDSNTLMLVGYAVLDDANPDISDIVNCDGNGVIFGKPGTEGKNRVPIAATFERKSGGGMFTLINNHFKSKVC